MSFAFWEPGNSWFKKAGTWAVIFERVLPHLDRAVAPIAVRKIEGSLPALSFLDYGSLPLREKHAVLDATRKAKAEFWRDEERGYLRTEEKRAFWQSNWDELIAGMTKYLRDPPTEELEPRWPDEPPMD